MEAKTTPIVVQKMTLDPDGDVFLQLDGYELQVSSRILGIASPVWKKLCTIQMEEGAQLSAGVPCHITLADDPIAMITLCEVLHHRKNTLDLSIEDMESLAIVSDKYLCVDAMSRYASLYFAVFFRTTDDVLLQTLPYGRLLYPAIKLDDPYAFQELTKLLVYYSPEVQNEGKPTIKKYGIPKEIMALLPENLLESIMVKEWSIKTTLLEGIEKLAYDSVKKDLRLDMLDPQSLSSTNVHSKTAICQCDCTRVMIYLKHLANAGVWPIAHAMKTYKLHEIIAYVRSIRLGKASEPAVYAGTREPCETCIRDFEKRLMFLREAAETSFKGYCLDCVNNGGPKPDPEGGACRMTYAAHLNLDLEC